ncbi:hypothetical protein [Streptomyces sp. NPDC056527]|uniref:hypothetical protein n=1 Tax=Streptomyces sp. NPDC056527 TaxID=3345853 RepID=UPI0036822AFE
MYGHGFPPQTPQRAVPASVIVLRVLFAVLPLLSIGFLTWGTMIRLAVVTRRTLDWILCGVSAAVMITGLVLLPDDVETTQADVAMSMILLNALGFTVYFLVADIRHDKVRLALPVPPAAFTPYGTTVPQHRAGYGYPPQPGPVAPPQAAVPPQPAAPSQPPQPAVPPQPPVPGPRIDQVRAELDELSDLLRKEPKDPREGGR